MLVGNHLNPATKGRFHWCLRLIWDLSFDNLNMPELNEALVPRANLLRDPSTSAGEMETRYHSEHRARRSGTMGDVLSASARHTGTGVEQGPIA
jgi:hypothetical protein